MNRIAGMKTEKTKILIVCRWPLGGIRTYLRYNYSYFPKDEFKISILANPTIEKQYLEKDMKDLEIELFWSKPFFGKNILFFHTARLLAFGKFDAVHSQGFISAFHVALVNWIFRVPHVLTIHGILEEKYLAGKFEKLKRMILSWILSNVSVFHGVSNGILDHLRETFPKLVKFKATWIVIYNGIDPQPFMRQFLDAGNKIRRKFDLEEDFTIFGFFGRFMPQKGFKYIIEAVNEIKKIGNNRRFIILAVGSGDYERAYKNNIKTRGLDEYFRFMSFNAGINEIIAGCNAVLMPSNWEAYPLLSSEVLCAGVPLIASDCIGLREATRDTPTITIPSSDSKALADAMIMVMNKPEIKENFAAFRNEAAERFDAKKSADKLIALFRELTDGKKRR